MNEYTETLLVELRNRAPSLSALQSQKKLRSIYFGGGTPSLLPAEDILAVLTEIANLRFARESDCEITIEINPGTVSPEKLDLYLASGVNRFSVGVQTFNDSYLKACGREHDASTSRETLRLLSQRKLNYSFDLLFGLPNQTLSDLKTDLDQLLEYSPPHVSLYNLTIPEKHAMNKGRASDDDQAAMFELIEKSLLQADIHRYEISNFSKPGFESRHNQLYWQNGDYWGVGVSSHSYFSEASAFGLRFWNEKSASGYKSQALTIKSDHSYWDLLPPSQVEKLALHEALTDFFHTRLRQVKGFELTEFNRWLDRYKVPPELNIKIKTQLFARLDKLSARGLIEQKNDRICLSKHGYAVANTVFLELTFSSNEI